MVGGVPHPRSGWWGGGTPSQVLMGGTPRPGLDGGGVPWVLPDYPIPGVDGGGWVPWVPPYP